MEGRAAFLRPESNKTARRFSWIAQRIGDAGVGETFAAQLARIARSTGTAGGRWIIAGMSQSKVDAKRLAELDDTALAQLDERCMNLQTHRSFDTGTRREVGHALEGFDIFLPAIRISRIIDRIYADKDVGRVQHFGPRQRVGKEYRVARWNVGNRDACRHCLCRAVLWDVDIRGERAAADAAQIDGERYVAGGAQVLRDAIGRLEFKPVPLTIVKRQRIALEAVAAGHRERSR